MKQHDLLTILSQMQIFNIPGFAQLLSNLKDPLLPVHVKGKMKSIDHNIDVLKERLHAMQASFGVRADEVNDYMANLNHFTEQEQKVIANVERELGKYWRSLTSDLTGKASDVSGGSESKSQRGKKIKSGAKPQGGRRSWIAS